MRSLRPYLFVPVVAALVALALPAEAGPGVVTTLSPNPAAPGQLMTASATASACVDGDFGWTVIVSGDATETPVLSGTLTGDLSGAFSFTLTIGDPGEYELLIPCTDQSGPFFAIVESTTTVAPTTTEAPTTTTAKAAVAATGTPRFTG